MLERKGDRLMSISVHLIPSPWEKNVMQSSSACATLIPMAKRAANRNASPNFFISVSQRAQT